MKLTALVSTIIKSIFNEKWKSATIALIVLALILIGSLVLAKVDINNLSLKLEQKSFEIEKLQTDNKRLRDKINDLGILGDNEKIFTQKQNIKDFLRDWDTIDFYVREENIFCPKHKGDRNYQRMYYKPGTSLVGLKFDIKLKMIDESGKNYSQRVIMGIGSRDEIISEIDIPTRESQIVNFREASSSGNLKPVKPGKSISSPMKKGSVINMSLESKAKLGSEITEILALDYISQILEYGDENDKIDLDIKIDDSHPETANASIFLGSYVGGCIQVINWSVI